RNLILDFGDVFINLDKPATARAMMPFGFTGIDSDLQNLFNVYEKGTISSDAFLNATAQRFPKASRAELVAAWNAILLDFPDTRLEFLEQLAVEGRYRLFLLSNTNEIHIDHVKKVMGQEKFNRFQNAFEVFYLSYEMGMRKPDSEIFQFVLDQNQLQPEETLFVDDTLENISSAKSLGIQTWHLQVGQEDFLELKSHL
ncbi:MAG: HAD family phosphatase, partial [Bacteroidota bacterium]